MRLRRPGIILMVEMGRHPWPKSARRKPKAEGLGSCHTLTYVNENWMITANPFSFGINLVAPHDTVLTHRPVAGVTDLRSLTICKIVFLETLNVSASLVETLHSSR